VCELGRANSAMAPVGSIRNCSLLGRVTTAMAPTGKQEKQARRRLVTSVDVATASKTCAGIYEKESEEFEFCVLDVMSMDNVEAAYAV